MIADRGFVNRRSVNDVLDNGGDVLVRMNLSSLPLTNEALQQFQAGPSQELAGLAMNRSTSTAYLKPTATCKS
ncbi:hypothetical protein HU715_017785 [Pseudomonas sp. SWRI12]|uniref:Uncharacterized protein n=1 Tax=Pseudomonas zanjanensis TaxID=2745496 RepID=A0A923FC76_9PSED|nr:MULTISPECIES: hypothetical protein [Pseudomonas]MBC3384655.1 hypothetical protein [Pseudomonas sp. SWRI179]MBV4497198.1 hypothetical protein [Pseudomonas zanjanensis]